MQHITAADITAFEKIYRLNFVNGLPGYKPANLVGTAAPDGRTNLAIFSSVLHLGSDPAVLGMVTRPTTVPRHTYQTIKDNGGCYTLAQLESSPIHCSNQPGNCGNPCNADQVCVAGTCTGVFTSNACIASPCPACGTGTVSCKYPGTTNEFICVTGTTCPQ